MNENELLINALRCTVISYDKKIMKCEGCKYRLLEEIDENIPVPFDVEIEGKRYLESCDYDRIVLEAAEKLEKLN